MNMKYPKNTVWHIKFTEIFFHKSLSEVSAIAAHRKNKRANEATLTMIGYAQIAKEPHHRKFVPSLFAKIKLMFEHICAAPCHCYIPSALLFSLRVYFVCTLSFRKQSTIMRHVVVVCCFFLFAFVDDLFFFFSKKDRQRIAENYKCKANLARKQKVKAQSLFWNDCSDS